jgi:uncharacterized membrane protein YkoI
MSAPECSIHPTKSASDTELHEMAKISAAEAEKYARARLGTQREITTSSAELEAEGGCLIWSFDMAVAGQSGMEEVNVDAGNGQILSVHHESQATEASEAADEMRKQTSSSGPKHPD